MEESAGILVTTNSANGNTGYRNRWDRVDFVKQALDAQVAEVWVFSTDRDEILHSERAIFANSLNDLFTELEKRHPPPGPEFFTVMMGRKADFVLVLKHPLLEVKPEEIIGGEASHHMKRIEAMAAARVHGCICITDQLRWGEEVNSVSKEKARDPWQNTEFSNTYLLNEGFVLDAHADNLSGTKRLWCDSAKYNRILSARRTALKRNIAKEKAKAKGIVRRPSYVSVGLTKERVYHFKEKLYIMWGKKCGFYGNRSYCNLWTWDGSKYGRVTKISHISEIGMILEDCKAVLARKAIRKMAGFRGFILDFHHGLDRIKDLCLRDNHINSFCGYVEDEYKRIPAKYKKAAKKRAKKSA